MRYGLLFAAILTSNLLGAGDSNQSTVYFVAAGLNNRPFGPPYQARLYQPSKGTLSLIRMLTPPSASYYDVQDSDLNVISVLYPTIVPTNIVVVHMDDPARVDDFIVNPAGQLAHDQNCLEKEGASVEQLLTLFGGDAEHPTEDIGVVKAVLQPASATPRVTNGSAADYGRMYLLGRAGGPNEEHQMLAYREGKYLLMRVGKAGTPGVVVDTAPPHLKIEAGQEIVGIVAATSEYRVFDVDGAAHPDVDDVWVHYLRGNTWKELSVEGANSRQRLFGAWLATLVQIPRDLGPNPGSVNPLDLRTNPGHSDERGAVSLSLPDVQSAYVYGAGRVSIIPGVLELTNLQDGRHLVLKTGEEDSEILLVTSSGSVYYRVNDSIFEAQIKGSVLEDIHLFLKDENAPEVHWAFVGPRSE